MLNVPADATEDTVRQVFSQKGAIKSIVDRTRYDEPRCEEKKESDNIHS